NAGIIIDLVISLLFLPVTIFGLFACCCEKTSHLLRIYSILYNVFTIIEILDSLVAIFIIIAYRSPVGFSKDDVQLLFINVLIIFLMIYFALVISAYATNRNIKEEIAHSTNNASESNGPSAHKVSEGNVSPTHETPL
ncbi:5352_t:CDS:2, partial [Cetraspora pellucida]